MVRLACQDPDIQHFTTVPRPYLLVHAQEFIAAGARLFAERQGVNYAICDSDDRMLGAISFVAIDAPARQAEIGYWVAPWGRGQRIASCSWAPVTRRCQAPRHSFLKYPDKTTHLFFDPQKRELIDAI